MITHLSATRLFACGLMAAVLNAGAVAPVNLMPAPSEVQWGDRVVLQSGTVVVLPDQATAPEREAAKLLCRYVEKRFGETWPTVAANAIPAGAKLRIFLGQATTFPTLNRLCEAQRLAVPSQPEGYALKVWTEPTGVTAVVAAVIPRAVIYGADTLFQLLSKRDGKLTIQEATIRDWPTIPLRGRPASHYQYFKKLENFDIIMSSRCNFIDVRDGIYAFLAGAKLEKDVLSKIIREGKNRGLRVYATVNSGVAKSEQDAVIATFKEFIEMGADGLWVSFDDKLAGEDPEGMCAKAVALGKQHNITGDAIAITPPKGAYQTIKNHFNKEVAAVPGMEQAVWCWTSIPCAEGLADGKAAGLTVKPSWWHNWPRLHYPSLSTSPGAYTPVLDMADGWNHPTDKELKAMGLYVHAVLPWDGWQQLQHYLVPVLGWWSWRPEQYDKEAIRTRAYDMVFGPAQVETARSFDNVLQQAHDRFQFWSTHTDSAPLCPPRLKSQADRSKTLSDLKALQSKLAVLQKAAPSTSLLETAQLQKEYLEPMQREIAAGQAAAQAPYPEYWWPEHQTKVLNAVYDGDMAKADKLIAGVRARTLADVDQVEKLFAKADKADGYIAWWRKRANASATDWKALLEKRQANLKSWIAEYAKNVSSVESLLKNYSDAPLNVGSGAAEQHNHVLATAMPEARETFWGDWVGGIYERGGNQAAVFAIDKSQRVNANTFCEMPVNLPVSGRRDHLALLVYLGDANKEPFGLEFVKWRWSGYRALKILWGDKELWKADIGIPRLSGEWAVVPVPPLPADLKTLSLRIRIEDYRPAKNNLEIVCVGPIRLLELDR